MCIEAHDAGATDKSTYHLRLAAMAGLPTAMLLYALACRHGWGMRANQAEGVKWLRQAIDTAGLDVANAEEKLNSTSGKGRKLDPAERKKRKAQYRCTCNLRAGHLVDERLGVHQGQASGGEML